MIFKKKNLALFSTIFLFGFGHSQNLNNFKNAKVRFQYSANDTIPKVIYPERWETEKIIYVYNNQFTAVDVVSTMSPKVIDSIKITKSQIIKINNIDYNGKILVHLKPVYNLKLIKVKDFLAKYIDLKEKNFLFSVDGKILNDDPDLILVDEKTIMQIRIEKLDKIPNIQNFYLINLITRTPENILKANTIYIRGKDSLTIK